MISSGLPKPKFDFNVCGEISKQEQVMDLRTAGYSENQIYEILKLKNLPLVAKLPKVK